MKGISKSMRNPKTLVALGLTLLGIAACIPNINPSSNPTAALPLPSPSSAKATGESTRVLLPDLIIRFMYLELEGRQGNSCLSADTHYGPYGIRVIINNTGAAPTGSFFVGLNGSLQEVHDGLLAGQSIELHFAGTVPSGRYEAIADATNQVVESQEENNGSSFLAPTPSPPPTCVPTVSVTTTP